MGPRSATEDEWFRGIFRASGYLAIGSAYLLGAWILVQTGQVGFLPWIVVLPLIFTGITAVALLVHGYSWSILFDTLFRNHSPRPRTREQGMQAAFVVSVVAFICGFSVSLPSTPYYRAVVLGYLLFPYLPAVWGVVVAAHGVIFLLAAPALKARGATIVAATAAISLIVLALAAMSYQVLFPRETWNLLSPAWALAGLTAFGYAAAAWAWSSEISPS